jgi:4-hydroxybenzoate polyprenyltransferase
MIARIRLFVVVARPAVLLILAMFALAGLARSGHRNDPVLLARVLVVVVSFLVFSVAVNDIADEAIDRVNLAGDPRRPLVVGTGTRRELTVMAITGACIALAGAALLTWPALVVTACGLLVSAGYSIRPVRIADRGAIASLLLPGCYVAVPFLVGTFSIRPSIGWGQLELLAGLYLGFIGRIVLKDFRDLRGDSLFGKRTFLVRHGRRCTVVFSAAFMTAGTGIIAGDGGSVAWSFLFAALLAATLLVLCALARDGGHRRDENLISATAILGRGTVLVLLMHLEMVGTGWRSPLLSVSIGACFVVVTLGQARAMVRFGPSSSLTLPKDLVLTEEMAVSASHGLGRMPAPAPADVDQDPGRGPTQGRTAVKPVDCPVPGS